VILLFPDGTLPSRYARWILGAFVAVLVLFTGALAGAVAQAIAGHQLGLDAYDGLVVIDRARGWFADAQAAFGAVGAPLVVWCAARQVLGWRRATGERREQLKWLASGVTVAVVGLILGLLALPACIGVAVLRYRLYEIDQIISRTLAYTIVTGLLIGVYAGLVLLATEVLSVNSPVAVAAATLAAAALFSPPTCRCGQPGGIADRKAGDSPPPCRVREAPLT
jgi:two-component system, NarL family, sensor kinase